MSTGIRAARLLALATLLGATLSACSIFGRPVAQGPDAAGEGPTSVVQAYPAPDAATVAATMAAATAVAPTAAPAPTAEAAAPAAAPSSALLGPEWQVAYAGDLNADGRPDAVGWVPAAGVTAGATFKQSLYAGYIGPVSQLAIVQAGADGKAQVQFLGSTARLTAAGATLYAFDAARLPAAFMVKLSPGTPVLADLLQVNGQGEPYAQGIGLRWDSAALAYRIAGAGK